MFKRELIYLLGSLLFVFLRHFYLAIADLTSGNAEIPALARPFLMVKLNHKQDLHKHAGHSCYDIHIDVTMTRTSDKPVKTSDTKAISSLHLRSPAYAADMPLDMPLDDRESTHHIDADTLSKHIWHNIERRYQISYMAVRVSKSSHYDKRCMFDSLELIMAVQLTKAQTTRFEMFKLSREWKNDRRTPLEKLWLISNITAIQYHIDAGLEKLNFRFDTPIEIICSAFQNAFKRESIKKSIFWVLFQEKLIRIVLALLSCAIMRNLFNKAIDVVIKYSGIACKKVKEIPFQPRRTISFIRSILPTGAKNCKTHVESEESELDLSNWRENTPYMYRLKSLDAVPNRSDLANSNINILKALEEDEVRDRSFNQEKLVHRQSRPQNTNTLNSNPTYTSATYDHDTTSIGMIYDLSDKCHDLSHIELSHHFIDIEHRKTDTQNMQQRDTSNK
jgi:hypothetical protein